MMGGFHNQSLNANFAQGLFRHIVTALILSCEMMVQNCCTQHLTLPNHEEKIRNHLLENYLENDDVRDVIGLKGIPIRFIPETPESYAPRTNTYIGRIDIKVISSNYFGNRQDYYIVECKRLDGTQPLNQKYVDEGICRFTGSTPKYLSAHNRSIMLGFVVKNINWSITIGTIANIHTKKLGNLIVQNLTVLANSNDCYLCEGVYTNGLSLCHIFYDISPIVS